MADWATISSLATARDLDPGDRHVRLGQFVVSPIDDDDAQWLCAVGRRRHLDRPNPR
jgi:hypothetical protein